MASTSICTSDLTSITVRGRDLVNELVGELSFTEMLYFLSCGRKPDAGQVKVLDACLVTIMEHGINPSTIVARLIADTVPDEPQVAIAAGLLGVGLMGSAMGHRLSAVSTDATLPHSR